MATQIGVVKALIGEVTATAADGSIRTLQIGDMVYANELVSTGEGGAVEIEFADGSVMDLGRNSQALLDSEVFDPSATTVAETASDDVPDDIAAIQQALLEGEDPTEVGEATAAGAGVEGGGNEGHEPVFVDYLNPAITPDAGFDTIGVSNSYDLPEQDIIVLEEEEEAPPVVPVVSVSVDVEIEIEDPETDPPTDGIPTPDYPVLVSGNAASVLEGTSDIEGEGGLVSGTKEVIFVINLSAPFSQDVTVTYSLYQNGLSDPSIDPDAGVLGDDWTATEYSSIEVLIPAGSTQIFVPVEIVEDHLDEGNGQFLIVLESATNATINPDANTAHVTIYDDDTTPVANPDTNWVQSELPSEEEQDPLPSMTSGNVLTDNNHTYDPDSEVEGDEVSYEDQADTDEDGDSLSVINVSSSVEGVDDIQPDADGETIQGQYGTLLIASDGTYTYTVNPELAGEITGNEPGFDVFEYTITDGYNSPQITTLTITVFGDEGVQILNLTPQAEGGDVIVDEDGLDGANADDSRPGETDATESALQQGTFTLSAPDGVAILRINNNDGDEITVISDGVFTSDSITSALGNTLTITGYDSGTGIVTYTYELLSNEDHSPEDGSTENSIFDGFTVYLEDTDGDSTSDTLSVQIVDDIPVLVTATEGLTADEDSLDGANDDDGRDGEVTASTVLSGNLADNFSFGADGAAASKIVSVNGVTANEDGEIVITTASYEIVVDAESGDYTFELLANVDNGDIQGENLLVDAFNIDLAVTVEDGDGDQVTDTVTLNVDVQDDIPVLVTTTEDLTADEDSLDGANDDDGRDGEVTASTVLSGNLADNFSFGADGAAASKIVSVNGVTANEDGEIVITTASYEIVVDAESGDYTFELLANVDHGDVQGENLLVDAFNIDLAVTVEDGDGDQVTDTVTLNVDVQDDIPVIEKGTVSLEDLEALVVYDADTVGGVGTATAQINFAAAFLAAVTPTASYGADGSGGDITVTDYTLSVSATDGETGLTSDSQPITLFLGLDGVVYGSTADSLANVTPENTVLTVSVDETGLVTVTQLKPLDHVGEGNDLAIEITENFVNLSATATITDGDGDTAVAYPDVELSGLISVVDDSPFLSFTNIATPNLAGTYEGTFVFDVGADNTLSFAESFTSGDAGVSWTSIREGYSFELDEASTDTTLIYNALDSEGETFFTLTVNADGTYSVELVNPDPVTEVNVPSLLQGIEGGSNLASYTFDSAQFGGLFDLVATAENDTITISSTDLGVGDNVMHVGDVLNFAVNPTLAGEDANVAVTAMTFVLSTTAGLKDTDEVTFEITYDGEPPVTTTFTTVVGEVFGSGSNTYREVTLNLDPDQVVTNISLTGEDGTQFKITGLSLDYQVQEFPDDYTLDFDVVAVDSDGDLANASFDVAVSTDDDGVFNILGTNLNDILYGTSGDDNIDGGDGNDTVSYANAVSGVTVDLGLGTASGGEGNDSISNIENIIGSDFGDSLFGNSADNVITGGAGDDTLSGGAGADEFVWNDGDTGTDEITDFSAGEGDVLNLADLLDPDTTLDIVGEGTLDDYLTASFDVDSNTTTINVYTDGSAQGAENLTQSIIVNGDQTDLSALITSGNLNVDQS